VRGSHRAASILALTLGAVLLTLPARAQGRSGQAPGQTKAPRPGGGPLVPSPGNPSPAVPTLASWLDDASSLERGQALLGVSVARWSASGTRVWFAPSLFAMAGLSNRLGLGVSFPVYHLRGSDGATDRGIGDVTIFGKLGVVNPETHTVGLALAPVVVLFESPDAAGSRDVAWAVPVSLEARLDGGRVYGSAGYFSSGAVFVNGAFEINVAPRWAVAGTLGSTFATRNDASTGAGQRTDGSVALMFVAASNVALSCSVGRSFSGAAALDGGPWIAAGFSIMPRR
jgi:hypothetical protein